MSVSNEDDIKAAIFELEWRGFRLLMGEQSCTRYYFSSLQSLLLLQTEVSSHPALGTSVAYGPLPEQFPGWVSVVVLSEHFEMRPHAPAAPLPLAQLPPRTGVLSLATVIDIALAHSASPEYCVIP
jgi:hypothetical protein